MCVYEDHMSCLEGLSVHILLNDELQTVLAASKGEETGPEEETELTSF